LDDHILIEHKIIITIPFENHDINLDPLGKGGAYLQVGNSLKANPFGIGKIDGPSLIDLPKGANGQPFLDKDLMLIIHKFGNNLLNILIKEFMLLKAKDLLAILRKIGDHAQILRVQM
jgi:hypothetical protein